MEFKAKFYSGLNHTLMIENRIDVVFKNCINDSFAELSIWFKANKGHHIC
jgi:hypothetical protein